MELAQLAMPRGEEDAAGQRQRAPFGADRPSELGRVLEIVEDEQGVGPSFEFLESGLELLVEGKSMDSGRSRPPIWASALSERLGGVDPEDAVGIALLVAVDVFDGELGLADAPHAGQARGPDADGLSFLRGCRGARRGRRHGRRSRGSAGTARGTGPRRPAGRPSRVPSPPARPARGRPPRAPAAPACPPRRSPRPAAAPRPGRTHSAPSGRRPAPRRTRRRT